MSKQENGGAAAFIAKVSDAIEANEVAEKARRDAVVDEAYKGLRAIFDKSKAAMVGRPDPHGEPMALDNRYIGLAAHGDLVGAFATALGRLTGEEFNSVGIVHSSVQGFAQIFQNEAFGVMFNPSRMFNPTKKQG